MNLLHIDFASGAFDVIDSFWPIYVDAGIPTLSIEKPSSAYDIYEDDCGELKKNIDRQITGIDLAWEHITAEAYNYRIIGSGTFQKNTGVFVKLDSEYTCSYAVTGNLDEVQGTHSRIPPVYEGVATSVQAYSGVAEYGDNSIPSYSALMLGPDIPKGIMIGPPNYSSIAGHELYSQVMPWTSDTARAWNDLSPASDVETIDVDLYGRAFEPKTLKHSYGSSGNRLEINDDKFLGVLYTIGRNGSVVYNAQVLPKLGHESLLQRSNITGSFTWKGDPRMQPRDIFTFHKLDGTDVDCTIENITITHQGGGTSAEITYREGVV